MDTFLRCKISRGQFSREVAVRGTTFDGTEYSLFVEKDDVDFDGEFDGPLEGSEAVDGWMRVEVLQEGRGLALVRLPAEAFENGYFLTVNADQVQQRQAKQEA